VKYTKRKFEKSMPNKNCEFKWCIYENC